MSVVVSGDYFRFRLALPSLLFLSFDINNSDGKASLNRINRNYWRKSKNRNKPGKTLEYKTSALFISVVKILKSPGVVNLTFLTPGKTQRYPVIMTKQTKSVTKLFYGRIITSKSYNMNSILIVMVFLVFTFFVYCYKQYFLYELRRRIFRTGNRLKHVLEQKTIFW